MTKIKVNWHQAKAASDHLIRSHQVMRDQPAGCRFDELSQEAGEHEDFQDVQSAEDEMKKRGHTKYREHYPFMTTPTIL